MLKENLSVIRENIETAAKKSGRKAEDVTLVAVTKTIAPALIGELIELGVTEFGENRVQELTAKRGLFSPEIKWHMIGHVQTNKAKHAVEQAVMIQSLDNIRLAEEINKRAASVNKIMDVLIEVNIAGENTKFGVNPRELEGFVENMFKFPNICVRGLMCIAPFVINAEENRVFFKKMLNLYIDFKKGFNDNRDTQKKQTFLSMGMSGDYAVAIEEGANMVRIGTALFGQRA